MINGLLLAEVLHRFHEETGQVSGKGIPIKKIFVKNNNICIDETPLNEYGEIKTPDTMGNFLQKNFDMPIDTNPNLNLRYKLVSSGSHKPYVVINGFIGIWPKRIKINGEMQEQRGEITLKYKGSESKLILLSNEKNMRESSIEDMSLKMDKKHYFIGESSLYDVYKQNGIIRDDRLPKDLFKKITDSFFDYILSKKLEFRKGGTPFALYILPNNDPIDHKEEKTCKQETGRDALGNTLTPTGETTQGVYFLSYDDPAFAINCKDECEFYKDIGIGKKSLEKILLPNSKAMKISDKIHDFNWYFFDLEHCDKVFKKRLQGIYDQLYYNYIELKRGNSPQVNYNVMCFKSTGVTAKIEVMINENLTMKKLESIFGHVAETDVIRNAYEVLIIKRGSNVIYRYYINAIKSLLGQTRVDLDQLYKIFTEEIRHKKNDWFKKKSKKVDDAVKFFQKTQFCLKTLYYRNTSNIRMNRSEEFAFNVGIMACSYITFREDNGFVNNSLRDIISKPRYDIDTLQYVVKSICRGINLLKISDEKREKKQDEINEMLSNSELPTDLENGNKDLSYYFYAGYCNKLKEKMDIKKSGNNKGKKNDQV